MSLDQNLMGLGLPAALAARIASGGTGPVNVTASANPGPTIGGKQFVVYVGAGSGWVTLPKVGGSDMAPEVADDFVIHNGLTTNLTIGIPTGVTVNIAAANLTGNFTLTTVQTITMWVVSATQWFGIKG